MPRWLSRVGSFGGSGFLRSRALLLDFRPKGLLPWDDSRACPAHAPPVNSWLRLLALVVIYTLIATSTVVVPITASFVARQRMEPKLIGGSRLAYRQRPHPDIR